MKHAREEGRGMCDKAAPSPFSEMFTAAADDFCRHVNRSSAVEFHIFLRDIIEWKSFLNLISYFRHFEDHFISQVTWKGQENLQFCRLEVHLDWREEGRPFDLPTKKWNVSANISTGKKTLFPIQIFLERRKYSPYIYYTRNNAPTFFPSSSSFPKYFWPRNEWRDEVVIHCQDQRYFILCDCLGWANSSSIPRPFNRGLWICIQKMSLAPDPPIAVMVRSLASLELLIKWIKGLKIARLKFVTLRQWHSRNSSDSRFRAKRCISDEISKASDLDMGDSS